MKARAQRRKNPSSLARSRTSCTRHRARRSVRAAPRKRLPQATELWGHSASNAAKRQEKGGEYALWLQYAAAERVVSLGAHERAKGCLGRLARVDQSGSSEGTQSENGTRNGNEIKGYHPRRRRVLVGVKRAGSIIHAEGVRVAFHYPRQRRAWWPTDRGRFVRACGVRAGNNPG